MRIVERVDERYINHYMGNVKLAHLVVMAHALPAAGPLGPKSHAHRLLQTLVEQGYAVQDEDRRYLRRIAARPDDVESQTIRQHRPNGLMPMFR